LSGAEIVAPSGLARHDGATLLPFLVYGGMRTLCRRLNALRSFLESVDRLDEDQLTFVVDWLSTLSDSLFMADDDPRDPHRVAAGEWKIVPASKGAR
jgi:hypothetical protein